MAPPRQELSRFGLTNVHDFALMWIELDQPGEPVADRLELFRTLHGGQVLRGLPLEVVEHAGAVGATTHGVEVPQADVSDDGLMSVGAHAADG